MRRIWDRLRQWTYPPEFRVTPPDGDAAVDALRVLLEQAQTTAAPAAAGPTKSLGVSPDDGAFAVEIGNIYFRLRRNVLELRAKSPDSAEATRLGRVVESFDAQLRQRGIVSEDLEGQRYVEGRMDLDPIDVQEVPNAGPGQTIGRCERPKVTLNGKIVQKARGIVLRPKAVAQGGS
jgi:hypothetical protein